MAIIQLDYEKNGHTYDIKVGYRYNPPIAEVTREPYEPPVAASVEVINVYVKLDGEYRAIKPTNEDYENIEDMILEIEGGE